MPARRGRLMIYEFAPTSVVLGARHWLEADIENALFRQLGTVEGRIVERQVECCGNIPDLVQLSGRTYIIVEIKRDIIGWRALAQITRYVDHWIEELGGTSERYDVMGILAAPAIRPAVRAEVETLAWCTFLPVVPVRRAA